MANKTSVRESQSIREKELVEADRLDREREQRRKDAVIQIESGSLENYDDARVHPTKEWHDKNDVVSFTPIGYGNNARNLKTVRRVSTPHIRRYFNSGKINEEQYMACSWYSDQHEKSGLIGTVKTSKFEQSSPSTATSGYIFTESQLEAQDNIRLAKSLLPKKYIKFFELVVCDEISCDKARKMAPSSRNPMKTLQQCADIIHSKLKDMK